MTRENSMLVRLNLFLALVISSVLLADETLMIPPLPTGSSVVSPFLEEMSDEGMMYESEMIIPNNYMDILSDLQAMPGFPKIDYDSIDGIAPSEPQMIESYGTGVESLIRNLPNSELRNGLEKYLEIINARSYSSDRAVGSSNQGLGEYHQQTVGSNPCFATIAENFYSEIGDMDSGFDLTHPLRGRPSLAEEAGKGRFSNLEPGWLMEKALEATNGDANLAIELIGLCGHDDVSQYGSRHDGFAYDSTIGSSQYNLESVNEVLNFEILDTQTMISVLGDLSPQERALKEEYLRGLQEFKDGVNNGTIPFDKPVQRKIQCPGHTSSFYAAKSLGVEVDLSEEQKRRVEVVQAPTRGREVLPAKNYHFMGAAFMACKLVQQGVSPGTAQLVQTAASWAYRTIRINSRITEDLELINSLDEMYDDFVRDFQQTHSVRVRGRTRSTQSPPSFDEWMYRQVRARQGSSGSEGGSWGFGNLQLTPIAPPVVIDHDDSLDWIPVIENFPEDVLGPHGNGTFQSVADIAQWRIRYDAAKLMDSMTYGGGSVMGYDIPHTNLSFIIHYLNDPIARQVNIADLQADDSPSSSETTRRRRGVGYRPFNWPRERYTQAQERALTYLVDWEWTTNQHEIGAGFGAQNCSRQEPDSRTDDQACAILGERSSIICDLQERDRSVADDTLEFLGEVSSVMTEQYLDPALSSSTQDGVLVIEGAF
jgi:hypothetical protein